MLFLYRPRQTYMPYRLPRTISQQTAYNREMQAKFDATRRVASTPAAVAAAPAAAASDPVARLKELAQLHESGALDDEEFSKAKAQVLGSSA